MPNRRTYTDDQLRAAVVNSTCWADVMERLGKPRGRSAQDVRKVADDLGLDASHFVIRRRGPSESDKVSSLLFRGALERLARAHGTECRHAVVHVARLPCVTAG
jgi:hypothetical protein